MGLPLYIMAWILDIPLTILSFVAVQIKYAKAKGFLVVVNDYFYTASVDKDRFGNRNHRTLFNMCLIKKTSKHLFGDERETISSVLGKNQVDRTLTVVGWIVVGLLWLMVNPKQWDIGHCRFYILELKTIKN